MSFVLNRILYEGYHGSDHKLSCILKRLEPPLLSDSTVIVVEYESAVFKKAEARESTLKVACMTKEDKQSIPGWTAFNATMVVDESQLATIRYSPFKQAIYTHLA
jgi:hypothetical protein